MEDRKGPNVHMCEEGLSISATPIWPHTHEYSKSTHPQEMFANIMKPILALRQPLLVYRCYTPSFFSVAKMKMSVFDCT